ncbi:MAG: cell division protein [Proteobacteria bacterium]|nr:cell division protein [Pseudomonadota bacterium]
MATNQNNNDAAADPSEIKRKLAWRMGVAGLMIIGLLGALALFDRLSTPSEPEPSAPQFTEPVPVAKKMITQPVTPAEPVPEAAKAAGKEASVPESSAPPVDKSAPRAEPPPRPAVAAQPALPRAAQPAGQARPAASQSRPAAAATTASVPSPRSESPVAAAPPAPPRLFSGYALQAGVFSDPRRAEELNARLILEGIPSSIEARVQVGPFKSRAEAEEVRQKMKAMGIDSVMLPPPKAKR